MGELEGVLRLLLGASVQVSRGGKDGSSFGCRGGGLLCQLPCHISLQCEHRELFIRHIQGLSLEVQSELAAAIQEVQLWTCSATRGHLVLHLHWLNCSPCALQVTQPGAGLVLALAGPEPGELASPELEMLFRSLMGTLLRLARERDAEAQVRGGRGITDLVGMGGPWGTQMCG